MPDASDSPSINSRNGGIIPELVGVFSTLSNRADGYCEECGTRLQALPWCPNCAAGDEARADAD